MKLHCKQLQDITALGRGISSLQQLLDSIQHLINSIQPLINNHKAMERVWHTLEFVGNTIIFLLAGALVGASVRRLRALDAAGDGIDDAVSGSAPPDRTSGALEMVTSPDQYPIWRTPKPVIIARGVRHDYRYSIRSAHDVEPEPGHVRSVKTNTPELHKEDDFGVTPPEPPDVPLKKPSPTPGARSARRPRRASEGRGGRRAGTRTPSY